MSQTHNVSLYIINRSDQMQLWKKFRNTQGGKHWKNYTVTTTQNGHGINVPFVLIIEDLTCINDLYDDLMR
jgi:hypothetical protein